MFSAGLKKWLFVQSQHNHTSRNFYEKMSIPKDPPQRVMFSEPWIILDNRSSLILWIATSYTWCLHIPPTLSMAGRCCAMLYCHVCTCSVAQLYSEMKRGWRFSGALRERFRQSTHWAKESCQHGWVSCISRHGRKAKLCFAPTASKDVLNIIGRWKCWILVSGLHLLMLLEGIKTRAD